MAAHHKGREALRSHLTIPMSDTMVRDLKAKALSKGKTPTTYAREVIISGIYEEDDNDTGAE